MRLRRPVSIRSCIARMRAQQAGGLVIVRLEAERAAGGAEAEATAEALAKALARAAAHCGREDARVRERSAVSAARPAAESGWEGKGGSSQK